MRGPQLMSGCSTRAVRAAVGCTVLALVASGCGSRLGLSSAQREAAAHAALGVGGVGAVPGGPAGASSPGGPAQAAPGGPGGAAGPVAGAPGPVRPGATGPAQGGTAAGGGTTGGPAAVTDNGGATDVGVTATTITLGNVSDLSGPVPGLFQGAVDGTEAYLAYLNSTGGVYGRQVRLKVADGQTDCTANQNAHAAEIDQVFAFTGSFSLYDDCGTTVVQAHPDVPDVSFALGTKTQANTVNQFSPQYLPTGGPSGPFCWFAQKYPQAVKKAGSIYANIPSAAASQKALEKAAETCGWTFVDSLPAGATDTTFNAQVNRMRSDGVQVVFEDAITLPLMAEIKKEADAQNWKPLWFAPVAYGAGFMSAMGSPQAAEGVMGYNLYALFLGQDEAQRFPEVALFQQWMKRVHPDAPLDLFAAYGWGAAKLFAQEAKAAGPKLTRKAFLAAIRTVHSYDAGKLLATSDIGGHQPPHCYVLWQIHDGTYSRMESPGDYRCDGSFVRS